MTNDSISCGRFQRDGEAKTVAEGSASTDERLFDDWFDPIEHAVRARVRSFIEELIESELSAVLARPRYGRRSKDDGVAAAGSGGIVGYRHGSRTRTLTGTFGRTEFDVPRARLQTPDGKTTEWNSGALRSYQRRTRAAEAVIAGAYLAGVNTRRVRRALAALFGGAIGKDIVSRTWRKVKSDRKDRGAAQGVHPQMAAQASRRRRQPGGGGRAIVCIHTIAAEPVEERANDQRHRTPARGVQAADQDADRAALRRNRRHAVLGVARFRTDQHAKGRRLADARECAHRSAY